MRELSQQYKCELEIYDDLLKIVQTSVRKQTNGIYCIGQFSLLVDVTGFIFIKVAISTKYLLIFRK